MVQRSRSLKRGVRHIDPYTMLSSIVSLALVLVDGPWWSLQGAADSNLFSIQVSPYYLKTFATGIDQTVPFAGPLGFATRILLIIGFLFLLSASVRPNAWWHDLASYFGMSALAELFLSFFLMLHAAETMFLGAYGSPPPFSGTGQLSGSIVGLDLAYHFQPLVTAGFSIPLYAGLVCVGLLGFGLVVRVKRRKKGSMLGVEAIFTAEVDGSRGEEGSERS